MFLDKPQVIDYDNFMNCQNGGFSMCECCSNHAAGHRGHIHIKDIFDEGYNVIKHTLKDIPGIVSVDYTREQQQAKVVFDKRLLDASRIEKILASK
jgi:hypothetical protein